jgi:hypothetical protein
MNTNDMTEILRLADVAAGKNDRWLFLAVLLVLGLVVWLAVRWLIIKHEALLTEHRDDQRQYTSSLVSISTAVNATNRELAVVLSRNSAALDDNTSELRRCFESRKRA